MTDDSTYDVAKGIRFKPRRKNDKVAEHFDETLRVAAYFAMEEARQQFARLNNRCESEIESLLASAFVRHALAGDGFIFAANVPDADDLKFRCDTHLEHCPNHGQVTAIAAQVDMGAYRVDFLVMASRIAEEGEETGRLVGLVVECDGHDFHERTKAQAARDRRRDREMLMAGWNVMRFTGSELWRDADVCASQVMEHISAELHK